jgi:hypothetical protein
MCRSIVAWCYLSSLLPAPATLPYLKGQVVLIDALRVASIEVSILVIGPHALGIGMIGKKLLLVFLILKDNRGAEGVVGISLGICLDNISTDEAMYLPLVIPKETMQFLDLFLQAATSVGRNEGLGIVAGHGLEYIGTWDLVK